MFAENQFFEKIISRGGQQLIVLNPYLDSLGQSGLKNIGLPPGTGWGCFQSSQDVVQYSLYFEDITFLAFNWCDYFLIFYFNWSICFMRVLTSFSWTLVITAPDAF